MQTVILCGGLGTRLAGKTVNLPKSMVRISGRPFLHHQLMLLKKNGIAKIHLCVGHLGSHIEAYFKDGYSYGLNISYSYDGDLPLGTGGSTMNALDSLEPYFFLIYGDSYVDIDYRDVQNEFFKSNLPSMMAVYENKDRFDASNVEMEGHNIIRYSKKERNSNMKFIDAGVNIFSKQTFVDYSSRESFDLSELQENLASNGLLGSYETKARFYHIGNVESLKEFKEFFRSKNDHN